jgi:hypothetical protein
LAQRRRRRVRSTACPGAFKIHGKTRQGGKAFTYNFNSDEYAGEEVALTAVTTPGEIITKRKEVAARAGGAASWGMECPSSRE